MGGLAWSEKPWFCGWDRGFYSNVSLAIWDARMEMLFLVYSMMFERFSWDSRDVVQAVADSVLTAASQGKSLLLKRFSTDFSRRSRSSSSNKNTCCGFSFVFVTVNSIYRSHEYLLFTTSTHVSKGLLSLSADTPSDDQCMRMKNCSWTTAILLSSHPYIEEDTVLLMLLTLPRALVCLCCNTF